MGRSCLPGEASGPEGSRASKRSPVAGAHSRALRTPLAAGDTGPAAGLAGTAFQAAFFRQMGLSQQFRFLFDALPEVHFFAKDLDHRFVAASREVVRRLGCSCEKDLLGKRDRDFYPAQLWVTIEADDRRVFTTGEPLLNRLETWFDDSRVLDWFVTSKFPIRDEAGSIIGVMGFVRPYEGSSGRRQTWSGGTGLSRAIEHIRGHLGRAISIQTLADKAGLSARQLHRKFIEEFRMSPQEFVLRTRIHFACELLGRGEKSIAEIAHGCGFCDQSALTRRFRKQMGITPATYRKNSQRAA